jgi:CRISPR/Cas system CSM-associated protein Csm2 small subunit
MSREGQGENIMKMKRENIRALAVGIENINRSSAKLPFKVNYAIQRTLESIKPESSAIEKSIKSINEEIQDEIREIQKAYADTTTNDKGQEIPLVKDDKFVCIKRESEMTLALRLVVEKKRSKEREVELWLEEEVDVELHRFSITKEQHQKMEELGGLLHVLLPLITNIEG